MLSKREDDLIDGGGWNFYFQHFHHPYSTLDYTKCSIHLPTRSTVARLFQSFFSTSDYTKYVEFTLLRGPLLPDIFSFAFYALTAKDSSLLPHIFFIHKVSYKKYKKQQQLMC
jgi:hypothetical protein